MDLFKKCYTYDNDLRSLAKNQYPYFKEIQQVHGETVVMAGKEVIMAGSNNYLGLAYHPEVVEASVQATRKYGAGNTGSRFLSGTIDLHTELEEQLADFLGKEKALVFTNGFSSNQGVIVPLIGKGDYILSDRENHSSIVQGTLISKGMWGKDCLLRFRHNDMQDMERQIAKLPLEAGKLIVVDGVFSMSGELVNLPEVVRIAKKYNARIMLDDAHGLGVVGAGGKGTASYFGLEQDVDLVVGTFSKSLGSIGGFAAGDERVISYIKHYSPAMVFSASLSAGQVASALKALEILKREPERIEKLYEMTQILRNGLKELGLRVMDGEAAVVAIVYGDDAQVWGMYHYLFNNGVYTNPVGVPAVPQGMQMLRLTLMATHTKEHVQKILNVFREATSERKRGQLKFEQVVPVR